MSLYYTLYSAQSKWWQLPCLASLPIFWEVGGTSARKGRRLKKDVVGHFWIFRRPIQDIHSRPICPTRTNLSRISFFHNWSLPSQSSTLNVWACRILSLFVFIQKLFKLMCWLCPCLCGTWMLLDIHHQYTSSACGMVPPSVNGTPGVPKRSPLW